jgi:carbon-monoxide dehydrogenase medium subunit
MWDHYTISTSLNEALVILAEQQEKARVVAGGTDLVLEMERGVRKGIETLVDITRIPGFDTISESQDGCIHIGPLVTHNQCIASPLLRANALPLVEACWQVGSPQIRNVGTVAGNLITASPANDTITPLFALGASLLLKSSSGERWVPVSEFYTSVRKTVMRSDEMLVDISFPGMSHTQSGMFLKLGLRNAQAISVINLVIILDRLEGFVTGARIALGAVAPTIVRAIKAEEYLVGKKLTAEVIDCAALLAEEAAFPISDIRSSAVYREDMVRIFAGRAFNALAAGERLTTVPDQPVLLATAPDLPDEPCAYRDGPIETLINGQKYVFESGQHKTIANLLREEAGLTGTKIACGEGECGACTIWLDGKAVMSCLIPAPRAHGATITTVEGLEQDDVLHPVQEAFIEYGAVQCGFCTPGFLMSAAKLLDEKSHPDRSDILNAISGNLCRCTGYVKIVEAIEYAAQSKQSVEQAPDLLEETYRSS